MDLVITELFLAAFIALISTVLAVVWHKADKAERLAETNKFLTAHMAKNLDKTDQLTERLSSLESTVGIEIKNISVSLRRLEATVTKLGNIRER